ncbi:MAG TPA: twin-arginine translocase TatA/TatE family subunit [Longimicrobiaceae bacterium]|nr:twin-arginine translocase TatA/TatE family subunit [Longimicrobiaceae bacterium]
MFEGIGPEKLLLIFAILMLMFGGKRISDVATGLGRGIRDFKKAMNEPDPPAQPLPAAPAAPAQSLPAAPPAPAAAQLAERAPETRQSEG